LENQRERGWRETRERSGERLLGGYKKFPVTQENEEQEKNFFKCSIGMEKTMKERQRIYKIKASVGKISVD
jgi:hypothetical protein